MRAGPASTYADLWVSPTSEVFESVRRSGSYLEVVVVGGSRDGRHGWVFEPSLADISSEVLASFNSQLTCWTSATGSVSGGTFPLFQLHRRLSIGATRTQVRVLRGPLDSTLCWVLSTSLSLANWISGLPHSNTVWRWWRPLFVH